MQTKVNEFTSVIQQKDELIKENELKISEKNWQLLDKAEKLS